MTGTVRTCVLADIHGNARALAAALATARRVGFDRLVLLGDLLTYGVEPLAVLDLVHAAVAQDGAVLIEGNHDRLYSDLARGWTHYTDDLPDWIRESVAWTFEQLAGRDLATEFAWRACDVADGVYYAHANPFGAADWTYLNGPETLARAAISLARQGLRAGVFGHTHRARLVALDPWPEGEPRILADLGAQACIELAYGSATHGWIVDAGSIGQPRDVARNSTILLVNRHARRLHFSHVSIGYDVEAHKRGIELSGMSHATCSRLAGFFG